AGQTSLRASSVDLSGNSLVYSGTAGNDAVVHLGNLSGSGTVNVLSGGSTGSSLSLLVNPLGTTGSSSSAAITTNGLTVNGLGTQTLFGNLSGVSGDATVFGVATPATGIGRTTAELRLSDSAALTGAGFGNVNLRGGTLTL